MTRQEQKNDARRRWYWRNHEKAKADMRKWYHAHPELAKKYAQERTAKRRATRSLISEEERQRIAQERREKLRIYQREYKRKHPQKYNPVTSCAATKRWRDRNREEYLTKHCEQQKEYARRYPEKVRARNHRQHARKRRNGGKWTAEEWIALKEKYGNSCLCCKKSEAEIRALGNKLSPDHIFPLVLGGKNTIENLQPLCHGRGGCNNHKGTKYIDYRPKAVA